MRRGLRIAIIGSRGIPAGYGGFETFAQELAPRLVERGHEVTVYCRRGYTGARLTPEYRGVRLAYTSAVRQRSLEQLSHEAASIVDSLRRRFELFYFLGYRGAPFYIPLRALRAPVIVNTDGLEWRRRKWNRVGRTYLRFAEWLVAHAASDELISDARAIADHYRQRYRRESTYIPSGADAHERDEMLAEVLVEHGLQAGRYYLAVCRIEPENNVDSIIREFLAAGSDRELVIVGGMNYETPYWGALQEMAGGGRVRFLGPIYGPMLVESLQLGAYAYVHGHEVGGTNPALLQAMGCGNLAIALQTPFNVENAAESGRYWTKAPGSLADQITWADAHADEVARLGGLAKQRIRDHYTWDSVADAHDRLFRTVAQRHGNPVLLADAGAAK
jgi:glycosyltransferase involved in cell wall biosynthesis